MNKKIIICFVILITVIIGLFVYFKVMYKNKNNEPSNISSKNSNNLIKDENITNNSIDNNIEEKDENNIENRADEQTQEDKTKEADKPNLKPSDSKASDVTINVGDYEIRCGRYYGKNKNSEEIAIEITEDNTIKMDNQILPFSIGNNSLICDNGISFKVTDNNVLVYESEEETILTYND